MIYLLPGSVAIDCYVHQLTKVAINMLSVTYHLIYNNNVVAMMIDFGEFRLKLAHIFVIGKGVTHWRRYNGI